MSRALSFNSGSGAVLRLVHEALALSDEERNLICRLVRPTGQLDLLFTEVEHQRLDFARASLSTLSKRETEVARYVVGGATNKEIARQLGISRHTVEVHRSRAIDKLGADSTADFVRLATATGLTPHFLSVRVCPD